MSRQSGVCHAPAAVRSATFHRCEAVRSLPLPRSGRLRFYLGATGVSPVGSGYTATNNCRRPVAPFCGPPCSINDRRAYSALPTGDTPVAPPKVVYNRYKWTSLFATPHQSRCLYATCDVNNSTGHGEISPPAMPALPLATTRFAGRHGLDKLNRARKSLRTVRAACAASVGGESASCFKARCCWSTTIAKFSIPWPIGSAATAFRSTPFAASPKPWIGWRGRRTTFCSSTSA